MIECVRCGATTTDPDRWDPEVGTGRIFCDRCWPNRDQGAPLSARRFTEVTGIVEYFEDLNSSPDG
jgi:hypothetical protein